MKVLVVCKTNLNHEKNSVIGVATSIEEADKLVKEYYDEFEILKRRQIISECIEISMLIKPCGLENQWVYYESFNLNEL